MKFFNYSKKILLFIIIYLCFDIIFFALLPKDFKTSLYNNRAHRIKSFFYHHDLKPKASFYDHWGYEEYKIFTNNLGFKDINNRDVEFKKRNILFIGDSFTEGVGLRFEDTYSGIISKKLKKKYSNIEVLNAGVQSYSTSIYLAKIYHLLIRKKMPITDIVVMVSAGDIFDDFYKYSNLDENYILNHTDHQNKIIINFINFYKSNTLIYQFVSRITPPKVIPQLLKSIFKKENKKSEYQSKEKELLKISNKEILKMNFLNLKDYSYFYSIDEFNKWGKMAIDKSMNNLKEIINIAKQYNINVNLLYIYEPVIVLKEPNENVLNYIIDNFKNLEEHNSKFHLISDYLKSYEDNFEAYKNLFFIGDIHWNKKGNEKVAKEILDKIRF